MTHTIDTEKRKGALLVLTAGICWGLHGVFIKLAYSLGASFMEVFLVEGIIATLIFLAILRKQKSFVMPKQLADWLWLGLAGIASIGVGSFLFLSFSLGPVAIGATLLFLYLPQVYLYSVITSKESADPTGIVSILLLLIGASVATGFTTAFAESGLQGAIFSGAIASTCYALIFILTPKLSATSSATFRSFFLSSSNMTGSLLVLLLIPSTRGSISSNFLALAGLAVVLGVIGQALPILTMMKGIPLAGPSLSGVLASTELPIAVIASAIVLGEEISLQRGIGVALVFIGIVLFNLRKSK